LFTIIATNIITCAADIGIDGAHDHVVEFSFFGASQTLNVYVLGIAIVKRRRIGNAGRLNNVRFQWVRAHIKIQWGTSGTIRI
jgi:hypothetical protein